MDENIPENYRTEYHNLYGDDPADLPDEDDVISDEELEEDSFENGDEPENLS